MTRSVLRRMVIVAAATAVVTATISTTAGAAPGSATATSSHLGVKQIHPNHNAPTRVPKNTLTVRSSNTTGVVSPNPKVYLVFWGSQWSSDPDGAAPAMQNFFNGLYGSADTWGTILDQYCEGVPAGTAICGTSGTHVVHPTSSILGGTWFDNAAAEPSPATAAQLAGEAVKAAGHFGNTTQTPNLNAQYVILSATGTHPDNFPSGGFCAWHDFTTSSYGKLAYTNMPYVPDLGAAACTTLSNPTILDGYFSTETHEYAETVTDFWPSIGWNGSGGEIGDECVQLDARITLSTGTFDVQGLWSNAKNSCTTTG
jgi:serine protease